MTKKKELSVKVGDRKDGLEGEILYTLRYVLRLR